MSKTNNTVKKQPKRRNIVNDSTKTIHIAPAPPIDVASEPFKLGFWDKSCSRFTTKLWKPPLNQQLYTPNWGNTNKLLTFEKSHDIKNATKLNFLPSPELDNMQKKRVLFNKKFGAEISRFAKFIETKELSPKSLEFVHNYINDLNKGLVRIRKRKNQNNTLDAFDLSNSSFKRFHSKYSKNNNISDAEKKIMDPHISVFNNIHKAMDALDKIIRCKTVKILPTNKQKKIIDTWFQNSTTIYNHLITKFQVVYDECLSKCNKLYPGSPNLPHYLGKMLSTSKKFPSSGRKLRDLMINEYKKFNLPNCVLADIIINFSSNIKGNITKLLSCKINSFTIAPRNKQKNYALTIQKKYTSDKGFYSRELGEIPIDNSVRKITIDEFGRKMKKDNFEWSDIKKDYKLMYDTRYKGYVIFCPMERECKDVQEERKPIAIMDPGEVKFQELYGLDHTISIGKRLRAPIMKRFKRIEYMKKRLSNEEFNTQERAKIIERQKKKEDKKNLGKTKDMKKQEKARFRKKRKKQIEKNRMQKCTIEQPAHNKIKDEREIPKRNNLKRVIKRNYAKISNLVTELHNKTCLYLCRNYDRVMVTDFSCKKVNSKYGALPKVIKKVLGALSHYKFRQRLQNKSAEYRCQYLEVTEEYTSKTCCMCGTVNMGLKKDDRTLYCKTCEVIDRDVNGSINIFIKNRHEVLDI